MKVYATEELQERYEKLPDALKDAIFSTDVADKIFETGKKHGLTVEKIGFLAEETGRVILGLTRPNEFVPLLAERLGMAADAAQNVAGDINHQVFFPLREVLKSAHQVEVGEAALQKPPAVDLRSVPRPAASPPPRTPAIPQGTAKVPPLDLRAADGARARQHGAAMPGSIPPTPRNAGSGVAQPPLVDVGDSHAPASRPADFISKEKTEKTVAETRITPPPSAHKPPELNAIPPKPEVPPVVAAPPAPTPKPAPQPATPQPPPSLRLTPLSVSAGMAPTPAAQPQPEKQKIQPIDLRKSASPPASPPYPQTPPTPIPQSSPQVVPAAPKPKIAPIDLRGGGEIKLDFIPPPPTVARPAPSATEKPAPPPHPPTPVPKPMPPAAPPVSPAQPPAPKPETAPSPPPASKIPPIDLRREQQPGNPPAGAPKTKPWSGSDPYREPIE